MVEFCRSSRGIVNGLKESFVLGYYSDSVCFERIHKNTRQIFRLFRYAYPSSTLRCSRKRPSLLSLACASGRLSFAVGERYYCVYFLSASCFHVRTYADASFHITIQARSTNTRFTYVQSSTFLDSTNGEHRLRLLTVTW